MKPAQTTIRAAKMPTAIARLVMARTGNRWTPADSMARSIDLVDPFKNLFLLSAQRHNHKLVRRDLEQIIAADDGHLLIPAWRL
jgi:hypothetical protein